MIRPIWKVPFIFNNIYKSFKLDSELEMTSKNSIVIPSNLYKRLNIYNGKNFTKITLNENMIGHKLGEFVLTRKYGKYKSKKKKKK